MTLGYYNVEQESLLFTNEHKYLNKLNYNHTS